MAAFTLIFPHKRNPGNDRSAKIALDMLLDNTVNDFIILMDAADNKPLYPRINAMVQAAPTSYCVIISSDLFLSPKWDVPMLADMTSDRFVTGVVVESGAIGVHAQNLREDFGMTAETFRRDDFECWCQTAPMPEGDGWVVPLMFPRDLWMSLGGLDLTLPEFPKSAPDQKLLDDWKMAGGIVHRVRSYAYHLQRYSEPSEQEDAKRL